MVDLDDTVIPSNSNTMAPTIPQLVRATRGGRSRSVDPEQWSARKGRSLGQHPWCGGVGARRQALQFRLRPWPETAQDVPLRNGHGGGSALHGCSWGQLGWHPLYPCPAAHSRTPAPYPPDPQARGSHSQEGINEVALSVVNKRLGSGAIRGALGRPETSRSRLSITFQVPLRESPHTLNTWTATSRVESTVSCRSPQGNIGAHC